MFSSNVQKVEKNVETSHVKVTNEYSIFGTPSPFSKKHAGEEKNTQNSLFDSIFPKKEFPAIEDFLKNNPFMKKQESL